MVKMKQFFIPFALIFLFTGCGGKQEAVSVPPDISAESVISDNSVPEEPEIVPDSTGAIEEFNISDPEECKISWDTNGDGVKEDLYFDFEDQGDEAPSLVVVSLNTDAGWLTAYIEGAYGIEKIFEKEDDEGRYLDIYYQIGDFYYHDSLEQCTLRIKDGEIILEGDYIY